MVTAPMTKYKLEEREVESAFIYLTMLVEGGIMGLLNFCFDCLVCKDLQEPEGVPEGPTRIPDYIRCPQSWRCNFVPPPPPPSLDLEDEQRSGSGSGQAVTKTLNNQEIVMSRVFAEMISQCYQNWCRRLSRCFRSEEVESEKPSSIRGVGTMTSPISLQSLPMSQDGTMMSPAQLVQFQEGNLRLLPAPIPMISVPVDVHSGPITVQPGYFQGSTEVGPGLSSTVRPPMMTFHLPVPVVAQTHLEELQVYNLPSPLLISPPPGFSEETSSSADDIELELPLFLGHYRARRSNETFHESFKF